MRQKKGDRKQEIEWELEKSKRKEEIEKRKIGKQD